MALGAARRVAGTQAQHRDTRCANRPQPDPPGHTPEYRHDTSPMSARPPSDVAGPPADSTGSLRGATLDLLLDGSPIHRRTRKPTPVEVLLGRDVGASQERHHLESLLQRELLAHEDPTVAAPLETAGDVGGVQVPEPVVVVVAEKVGWALPLASPTRRAICGTRWRARRLPTASSLRPFPASAGVSSGSLPVSLCAGIQPVLPGSPRAWRASQGGLVLACRSIPRWWIGTGGTFVNFGSDVRTYVSTTEVRRLYRMGLSLVGTN